MTSSSKAHWWPATAASSTPACNRRWHEMTDKCAADSTRSPSPSRGGEFGRRVGRAALVLAIVSLALPHAALAAGGGDVDPFVYRFMVFVIAIFVGYFVVWSVTPALHTPLMSVTNAISSVIVVGALLAVGVALLTGDKGPIWARVLGFIALIFASVNIFGGFLVTQRMLGMYQKKK